MWEWRHRKQSRARRRSRTLGSGASAVRSVRLNAFEHDVQLAEEWSYVEATSQGRDSEQEWSEGPAALVTYFAPSHAVPV